MAAVGLIAVTYFLAILQIRQQWLRGPFMERRATLQRENPIGECEDDVEVVLDDQDRDLRAQPAVADVRTFLRQLQAEPDRADLNKQADARRKWLRRAQTLSDRRRYSGGHQSRRRAEIARQQAFGMK
jgi:hypothetical protein